MYKYLYSKASSFECISKVTDTKNGQSDHMFAVRDVEAGRLGSILFIVGKCSIRLLQIEVELPKQNRT